MSQKTMSRSQFKSQLLGLYRRLNGIVGKTLDLSVEQNEAIRALKARAQGVLGACNGLLELCFQTLGISLPLAEDHEPDDNGTELSEPEMEALSALFRLAETAFAIGADHYGTYRSTLGRLQLGQPIGYNDPVMDEVFNGQVQHRESVYDSTVPVYQGLSLRAQQLQAANPEQTKPAAIFLEAARVLLNGLGGDLKMANGLDFFDIYSREEVEAQAAAAEAQVTELVNQRFTDEQRQQLLAEMSDEDREVLDRLTSDLAGAFDHNEAADLVKELAASQLPGTRAGFLQAFDEEYRLACAALDFGLAELLKQFSQTTVVQEFEVPGGIDYFGSLDEFDQNAG